jgi:hypothetical protein
MLLACRRGKDPSAFQKQIDDRLLETFLEKDKLRIGAENRKYYVLAVMLGQAGWFLAYRLIQQRTLPAEWGY